MRRSIFAFPITESECSANKYHEEFNGRDTEEWVLANRLHEKSYHEGELMDLSILIF